MNSATTATDDWMLPAHHRFMAALCQSVQECIDEFRLTQDMHAIRPDDVDALFRRALAEVGNLFAASSPKTTLRCFLDDQEHVAYREMVEDPEQVEMRYGDTERVFADASDKIRRLVPGYKEEASDMWRLCIDPQTIALLKRNSIKVDEVMVGRFLFEGERQFLHNMARGWDFIADAALQERPLAPQFLNELNAICTGRASTDSTGSDERAGTSFGLLEGHTATVDGLKKIEETLAALRTHGLDVKLLDQGRYSGSRLNYYELHTEVNNQHDAVLLKSWMEKCVSEHQARTKDLQDDELALHDLELAIKLNQAHVYSDGNIRTCHLLLNFLRLRRGQPPFMFAEPNVMDGHTAGELLQKMKSALNKRMDLPVLAGSTSAQATLLRQVNRHGDRPAPRPKRNIPLSREFLAFSEYMQGIGKPAPRPHVFGAFAEFVHDRGLSLQKLKQSPALYFETRRACLLAQKTSERQPPSAIVNTGLLTYLSGYMFPELDVAGIIATLITKNLLKRNGTAPCRKVLWDLQGYLHTSVDGPPDLQALLGLQPVDGLLSSEQRYARFLATYGCFFDFIKKDEPGAHAILNSLRHKLASVFFPFEKLTAEQELLERFRESACKDRQKSTVELWARDLDQLKVEEGGIWIVELQDNMSQFVELYGKCLDTKSKYLESLHQLGHFLFPNAKAMEILDDLMNNELSEKANKGLYLGFMWKFECALRTKNIMGLEKLQELGPEKGIAHIEGFLAENKTVARRLDIHVLVKGIIARLFAGAGSRVRKDIEDLKMFIESTARQSGKSRRMKFSPYTSVLEDLRIQLEPAGWPDRNLGEFLEFRQATLGADSGSATAMAGPGTGIFNLLTIAAKLRYPALQEFLSQNLSTSGPPVRHFALARLLDFFSYLRDERRKKGSSLDGFLSDINKESVEAFTQSSVCPSTFPRMFPRERFITLALKFSEFLEEAGAASMARPAATSGME